MLEARSAVLARRVLAGPALPAALDIVRGCFELTMLESAVTRDGVRVLCGRAATPAPGSPTLAAVCVPPARVPDAVAALRGTSVCVAAVVTASGFASLEHTLAEVRVARAAGAREVEFPLDPSALLTGDIGAALVEIAAVRASCEGATLKVVLAAGDFGSYAAVRRAADATLGAGADFVKIRLETPAARAGPPLVLLMCEALRDHVRRTGRIAGLAVAGGSATAQTVLASFTTVYETLGAQWLEPGRFRIGAATSFDDLMRTDPACA